VNTSYNGDDLLLYNRKNSRWYKFPDFKNVSLYTLFSADLTDLNSDKLWSKVTPEGSYRLFIKGEYITDGLNGSFCKDDVVLYVQAEGAHYLLIDFKNKELFKLNIPQPLPQNTHAVWMKPKAGRFHIFVEGKNMERFVSPKMMDGNLLLLHEASNTIYVCMDYNNQPFDEFRPAVIMDAADYMK